MFARIRASKSLPTAVAYVLAVYAVLAAAAFGAHAARAAAGLDGRFELCIRDLPAQDGTPAHTAPCADICRIAALSTLDGPALASVASPAERLWVVEAASAAPPTVREPSIVLSARGPPA
jgi:hypothetical protein